MEKTVAVIDIGKSTTGLRIYSARNLDLLREFSAESRELREGGLLVDDIDGALDFVRQSLKSHPRDAARIRALVPVTMGATIVFCDENYRPVFPVVSYRQPFGPAVHRRFRDFAGGEEKIYFRTASPDLPNGLLAARQIFWFRQKHPAAFCRCRRILFLPQFIAARFAALPAAGAVEFSQLGCHTALYDFQARSWSYLAKKLGAAGKLFPARISRPGKTMGNVRPGIAAETGLSPACRVLLGGHDTTLSNLPYLLRARRGVVLSTGSWHIASYLGAHFSLPPDGRRRDILAYADIEGNPVMAARSALGFEFKHYSRQIKNKFPGAPVPTRPDSRLLDKILAANNCFVIPTLTPGSGQFPDSRPRIVGMDDFFRDAGFAHHVLELSLAIQAAAVVRAALGNEKRKVPVYLSGGAAGDPLFTAILSTLFPDQELVITRIREGTSLGAALLAKAALEGVHPFRMDPRLIDYHARTVPKLRLDRDRLDCYCRKFLRLAREEK